MAPHQIIIDIALFAVGNCGIFYREVHKTFREQVVKSGRFPRAWSSYNGNEHVGGRLARFGVRRRFASGDPDTYYLLSYTVRN